MQGEAGISHPGLIKFLGMFDTSPADGDQVMFPKEGALAAADKAAGGSGRQWAVGSLGEWSATCAAATALMKEAAQTAVDAVRARFAQDSPLLQSFGCLDLQQWPAAERDVAQWFPTVQTQLDSLLAAYATAKPAFERGTERVVTRPPIDAAAFKAQFPALVRGAWLAWLAALLLLPLMCRSLPRLLPSSPRLPTI